MNSYAWRTRQSPGRRSQHLEAGRHYTCRQRHNGRMELTLRLEAKEIFFFSFSTSVLNLNLETGFYVGLDCNRGEFGELPRLISNFPFQIDTLQCRVVFLLFICCCSRGYQNPFHDFISLCPPQTYNTARDPRNWIDHLVPHLGCDSFNKMHTHITSLYIIVLRGGADAVPGIH